MAELFGEIARPYEVVTMVARLNHGTRN